MTDLIERVIVSEQNKDLLHYLVFGGLFIGWKARL